MPYTSDDLVAKVRTRAWLPDTCDVSAADILAAADEELSSTLADIVRNIDPSWWLVEAQSTIASGTASYRLPGRSFGAGAERVELVDSAGNREPVTPIDLADAWRFTTARDALWPGRFGFVVIDDDLVLYPTPVSADAGLTLSVRYQRQPAQLVPVADCARVLTVSSTTALVITGTLPAGIATAAYVDYVRGDGSFPALSTERLISADADPSITLDASTPLPTTATTPPTHRADYLCPTGQTCYPRVPANLWPVLVLATAKAILSSTGDVQGAAALSGELSEKTTQARSVTTPRARQTPALINRTSYLRRGR